MCALDFLATFLSKLTHTQYIYNFTPIFVYNVYGKTGGVSLFPSAPLLPSTKSSYATNTINKTVVSE